MDRPQPRTAGRGSPVLLSALADHGGDERRPIGRAQRIGGFGKPGQGESPSSRLVRRASAHATKERVSAVRVRVDDGSAAHFVALATV
jgi:hypothetical protein